MEENIDLFKLTNISHAAIEYSGNESERKAFMAGAIWQKEQMEANRIKHSDSITWEQFKLETDFVSIFIDKHNRIPTILDAIEYGMSNKTK